MPARPRGRQKPQDDPEARNALVLSFMTVRQTLGYLGLFLPLSLLTYSAMTGTAIEGSISEYYYTGMSDILVGTLAAIGVFLISYRGYARNAGEWLSDNWLARIGGTSALGVALFPVHRLSYINCSGGPDQCIRFGITTHPEYLHYVSAVGFFSCLALFCLFQFPRGERGPDGRLTWSPRCVLFVACGMTIVASMVAIVPNFLVGPDTKAVLTARHYVFWCESCGLFAFATSWLAKGRALRTLATLGANARARLSSR